MHTVRDTAAQCRARNRRAPFPEWGGGRPISPPPDRGGRRVLRRGYFECPTHPDIAQRTVSRGEYDTLREVSMSGTTRLGDAILVAALLAGCSGSGTTGPTGGGTAGGGGGGGGGTGGGGNGGGGGGGGGSGGDNGGGGVAPPAGTGGGGHTP